MALSISYVFRGSEEYTSTEWPFGADFPVLCALRSISIFLIYDMVREQLLVLNMDLFAGTYSKIEKLLTRILTGTVKQDVATDNDEVIPQSVLRMLWSCLAGFQILILC